jgi:oligoendopeptidase F
MPNQPIPARSEIPFEETWSTESIFPTVEAWEAAYRQVEDSIPALKKFQGRLQDSPAVLLDYLQSSELVNILLEKVGQYARLNYAVDATNQEWKARADQVTGLSSRVRAASAFDEPELLAIGFPTLRQWLEQEPGLRLYEHYLDRLEQRAPHIRSAEVEEVLSQVMDPFHSAAATHGILVNADLKFEPAVDSEGNPHELAHSNINHLMASQDRELRRTAWENYADAHLAFKHTQANALATGLRQDVFRARARRYASSLEAALKPNFIPLEVFHSTVDTFRANLPTWHRYWELRRRVLGLDRMHVYDTRAALTTEMPEIPFSQAIEWIAEGMTPLGEDYVRTMHRGVTQERWVDYRPNQGKRFGAFSSGAKGTHPFVMMSYNDDIFGVSTLAHELGHSMHSYYSRGTQPLVYSYYGMFLAEVASNFNQALVRGYLLETQTDLSMQIAILEEAMSNFHRYFFIMPTLARFELAVHEMIEKGQGLSAQTMTKLMADLFREAYGPGVEMDDTRVGSTWMQFSTHLYMNFYVYQYATGIAGAHALVDRILSDPQAAGDYLEFLKAGSSRYPLDTLRRAGVDLASPEPVKKAFALMAEYVDRLERLLE